MKVTHRILDMILVTIIVILVIKWNDKNEQEIKMEGIPTLEQVQKLGYLAGLKIQISDILEGTGNRVKGIWVIRGDAIIGVDMREAQISIIDKAQKKAQIILPIPIVMTHRVNHDTTKTYEVTRRWFASSDAETALRDQAMKQAQMMIYEVANEEENITDTKSRVEVLIKNFYDMVGWNVTVQWKASS